MAQSRSKSPRRKYTGDNSRMGRWLQKASDSPVTRGSKAWCLRLSRQSNAKAKPVWGNQTKQGKAIDCSARQVRRYRAECEAAGLITTRHGEVYRDKATGQITRTASNMYVFLVPDLPQKASSHRADTDDLSSSQTTFDKKLTGCARQMSKWIIDDPAFAPGDFGEDDPWTT